MFRPFSLSKYGNLHIVRAIWLNLFRLNSLTLAAYSINWLKDFIGHCISIAIITFIDGLSANLEHFEISEGVSVVVCQSIRIDSQISDLNTCQNMAISTEQNASEFLCLNKEILYISRLNALLLNYSGNLFMLLVHVCMCEWHSYRERSICLNTSIRLQQSIYINIFSGYMFREVYIVCIFIWWITVTSMINIVFHFRGNFTFLVVVICALNNSMLFELSVKNCRNIKQM